MEIEEYKKLIEQDRIVGNEVLSLENQYFLVHDKEVKIRLFIAQYNNITNSNQNLLAHDEELEIRLSLVLNKSLAVNSLLVLLEDDNKEVREIANKRLEELNKCFEEFNSDNKSSLKNNQVA